MIRLAFSETKNGDTSMVKKVISPSESQIPDLSKMSLLSAARWLKKSMDKYKLSQKEMAKKIGYSQSYVTIHLTLLTLPKFFSPLLKASPDYTAIYRLGKLYEKHPDKVEAWLLKNPTASSREIRLFLRDSIKPGIASTLLHDLDSFPYKIIATTNRYEGIVLQQPAPEDNKVWLRLIKSGKTRPVTLKAIKNLRFEAK